MLPCKVFMVGRIGLMVNTLISIYHASCVECLFKMRLVWRLHLHASKKESFRMSVLYSEIPPASSQKNQRLCFCNGKSLCHLLLPRISSFNMFPANPPLHNSKNVIYYANISQTNQGLLHICNATWCNVTGCNANKSFIFPSKHFACGERG